MTQSKEKVMKEKNIFIKRAENILQPVSYKTLNPHPILVNKKQSIVNKNINVRFAV